MRFRTVVTGLVMTALAAGPGGEAVANPQPGPADVQEMAGLFEQLCLHAFPDQDAVDRQAAAWHARPMTPAEVKSYLHADPGKGWYYATQAATYVVTIEQPPYRACAIRRMTAAGFATVQPYRDTVQRYLATLHPALPPISQHQQTTLPSGLEISGDVVALIQPGTRSPSEAFMVLLSNYHGHYQGSLATDAGMPGVEVRFVHQFPPIQ